MPQKFFASLAGPCIYASRLILQDSLLSSTEKLVLFCLFSYAHRDTGVASVARTQIARDTRLALSTVSKTVASLVDKNWLTVTVTCVAGGQRLPNVFRLRYPNVTAPACLPPPEPSFFQS